MYLRVVRVTIAPGKTEAYWAWAREILQLWDAAGVVRAGGPYAATGTAGEDVGVWLTVHESEEQASQQFRELYATGRGKELIALRPPLVAETTGGSYASWDGDGGAPAAPAW